MAEVVVTGAAGFIGHAVCSALLARGDSVVGLDDFNPYYAPALKRARAARLSSSPNFRLIQADVADPAAIAQVVADARPSLLIHLAAQAGVRHSLEAPFAYERANVAGHLSVLEACRSAGTVRHLVYASSSSVYGDRPASGGFSETDPVDRPISLYAATKRSCELMSEAYSSLYGIPQSGLRFFTVYGPWGRPDMAYYAFTKKIATGEPMEVYGEGRMSRDFTYIDDAVRAVLSVADRPPEPGTHRLLNVGSDRPLQLLSMIAVLEEALGRRARMEFKPVQPGDVPATWADISRLRELTGYAPETSLETGLNRFVAWWLEYHADDGASRATATAPIRVCV